MQQELIAIEADKQRIIDQIENENIRPTEKEQELANGIIMRLAELHSSNQETLIPEIKRLANELNLPQETRLRVEKTVMITAFGYGPLTPLINDDSVTEIIVISHDNVCVERGGTIESTDIVFTDDEHLMKIIQRIAQAANRQLNISHPVVDAELKDGSRVQITIPPVGKSPQMNIRKFRKDMMSYLAYINTGAIPPKLMAIMQKFVVGRLNILISGGTGTGKTTFLNVLSNFIPKNEIIVTSEDTYELQLQQPNVMSMRTRPSLNPEIDNITQAELLRASLRKRPDRIIQGEARGKEIFDMLNAMSSGHEGSIATIHANSPKELCRVRIPFMFRQNEGMKLETADIQLLISYSVEIIVQLVRLKDGRRKVASISYIDGINDEGYVNVVDMFRYNPTTDTFECMGNVPERFIDKLEAHGVKIDRNLFLS